MVSFYLPLISLSIMSYSIVCQDEKPRKLSGNCTAEGTGLQIRKHSADQVDKRISLQNDTSLQFRPSHQLKTKRGYIHYKKKKKTSIAHAQPQPRSPPLMKQILSRNSSRLRLRSLIRRRHSSRKIIINLLLRRTTRPVIITRSFPFSHCGSSEMLQAGHVGF